MCILQQLLCRKERDCIQSIEYVYYANEYGGEAIPEELFKRVMQKAEMYLNAFTFDRLKNESYDNVVKNCLCDMAETIYKVERQSDEKVKKSENIDGYSVSYVTEIADGQDVHEVLRKKLYGIAECYLMNTGLLYLGVE